MGQYYIEFPYDSTGHGQLVLKSHSLTLWEGEARTGSINRQAKLVNAIAPNTWYITRPSVDTAETGMVITPGKGWKIRLWRKEGDKFVFTHYLIHPDGGLGGTKGCVGLLDTDGLDLRERLDAILLKQETIPAYITDTVEG